MFNPYSGETLPAVQNNVNLGFLAACIDSPYISAILRQQWGLTEPLHPCCRCILSSAHYPASPIMRALLGEKNVLIPLLKLGILVLLAVAGCTQPVEVPSPTLAPTPATILPPTPKSTVTSPPTPAPELPGVATLSVAEVQGLTHPGIRAAFVDLRQRVGEELEQVQIVRAEQVTWSDSSLGCPEPGMAYLQVLTEGIWLVLSYQEKVFDYRVTGNDGALCTQVQQQEPLERRPLAGIWSTLAPVPTPRSEVAATELNGKIYVFGGFGAGATKNEQYDPEANTWRQRTPVPQRVDHAAAVSLAGKIYLIGGFDGRFRAVDTVWAYDPETNTWDQKADLPTPRGALGAAVVNGKIYAIGGNGFGGDVGTTEEYDPSTDVWIARSPMP